MTERYYNAPDSICPAGWELPQGPSANDANYSDIANLISNYNIIEDTIHKGCGGSCYYYNYPEGGLSKIRTTPLWLARSGNVVYGDVLGNPGRDGYYSSSTVVNSNCAYTLNFGSDNVRPAQDYTNRHNGYSIRCLAE